MSFVSYAQNYEDVMLFRALRGIEHGFYIDVGAQDPVGDSVTKAFYEKGWRGINIEPVAHWFQRLVADRPHDINLQVAVSDGPGKVHLFEVVDTGLSTTDPDFAKQYALAGYQICESDVDCLTLDNICKSQRVDEVHFLKIDCEGCEAAVLRGFPLDRLRPWVILLEATAPNSQQPVYMEWEPLLTTSGYHFVYEDGLNRFYVADEHSELDPAFSHPPNVFDYFVRASEAIARNHLRAAQGDLLALRDAQRLARIESECEQLRTRAEFLHSENERREAALVEHRRLLDEAAEREAQSLERMNTERDQWRTDLEYLRGENERREAALVEHRRLLDEATGREAQSVERAQVEREQWRTDLEYLRSQNERLEVALAEYRRLLEEVRQREAQSVVRTQVERDQWRADTDCLRSENERRDVALAEYRQQLADALECVQRQNELWRNQAECLNVEIDRKESALVDLQQTIETMQNALAVSCQKLESEVEHAKSLASELENREHQAALQRADLDGAVAEILRLQDQIGTLHFDVSRRDLEVARLHHFIQTIYLSTSWRITAPMRWLVSSPGRAVISVFRLTGQVRSKIKETIKKALPDAVIYITRRPQLKCIAVTVLSPFPALRERLRRQVVSADPAQTLHSPLVTELANLTPHARRIYDDLEAVVDRNKRDK